MERKHIPRMVKRGRQWTLEDWGELTPELIKQSVRVCAVTLSVDGVEDDQITCMKEGHPVAAAKPTLFVETQKLLKSARGELEEDDDPFADLDSDTEVDSGSLRDGELDNVDSDHNGDCERLLELFECSDEEDFFGFLPMEQSLTVSFYLILYISFVYTCTQTV